ncbi:ROK family protein [Acidithiobacillus sp.]|uniref:ROK family protein n=1 Tax=Acidithiobacillus sp. TaxID=1872118 RepID=UPI003D08327E
MPEGGLILGMDVGGTNLRLGIFRGGDCVDTLRVEAHLRERCLRAESSAAAESAVLDILTAAIAQIRQRHPQLRGVGIAFPGFIQGDGTLLQSPNLPGLHHLALGAALQERCGLPVLVENDANAAAFGEFVRERGRQPGLEHLLYVGLGTGVGGGFILHGQPWRGAHGAAMEVGHLIVVPGGRRCGCGNQGCLEQYASATGVRLSYTERTGHAPALPVIAQLAREGNADARAAFALAGNTLGQALAHLLKVLDVSVLRLGGGMSAAWDCFAPVLQERLEADLIPVLRGTVDLRRGNGDDQAGMRGAALLAAARQGGG